MASPMPMPPSLVLQNGSKTLCRSASAMPGPRSATQIATWASVRAVLTVSRRSACGVRSIASAALTIRFSSSCCSCTRSPSTGGSSALSSTDTATWRVSRFVRVRSSVSRTSSLTSSGTSAGSPRLNSAPRRRMTSAARWSSATMSSQISRSSARSTGSRCSIFCAASALLRIEASGWFSWCAIDADNWPSSDTRVMWRSAARSSSACVSARLRGVMSSATPSRCWPSPCAARPRAAIQRVCAVGRRHAVFDVHLLAAGQRTIDRVLHARAVLRIDARQHLLEVGERVGQAVGAASRRGAHGHLPRPRSQLHIDSRAACAARLMRCSLCASADAVRRRRRRSISSAAISPDWISITAPAMARSVHTPPRSSAP